MLARMYISTRAIVIAVGKENNASLAPQIRTQTKAITCMPTSRWIALTGVFFAGLTLPSAVGSTPERPMAYQVLVPPLKEAIDTAMAELISANSSSTQPPLHTRWAMIATGHGSVGSAGAGGAWRTP